MWLSGVDWWRKPYTVFGYQFVINWKMVLIVGCVWAAMFIFL